MHLPHQAPDLIVIASHLVLALQTVISRSVDPCETAVVTVGMLHAGTKSNILPTEAHLEGTVRTFDRKLTDRRVFPSIDIDRSGTRKEEKLLDEKQLAASRVLRRHLLNMPPTQCMKSLLDVLSKHKTNDSVFNSIRT